MRAGLQRAASPLPGGSGAQPPIIPPSPLPPAESAGGKNNFATALGLFASMLDDIAEFAYYKQEGRESNHAARFPGGEPQL